MRFHWLFVRFGGFLFNCDFVLELALVFGLVGLGWVALFHFVFGYEMGWSSVVWFWIFPNGDFVLSRRCFVCFIAGIISIVIGID